MALQILAVFLVLSVLHRGCVSMVREAIGETTFSVLAVFLFVGMVLAAFSFFAVLVGTDVPIRWVKA